MRHHITIRCCRALGLVGHLDTGVRLTAHLKRIGGAGRVLWAVYGLVAVLPVPVARLVLKAAFLRPAVGILAAAAWAGGAST